MMGSDIRLAVRGMQRAPGFAAACVVTLALGIGINTAIFSVVYAVLLRPLPYEQANRLYVIWKTIPKKNIERDWTSYPTFEDWKRGVSGFEDMAAYLRPDGSVVNWDEGEQTEQIQSAKVSLNFFDVLRTAPILGRTFTAVDPQRNASKWPGGDNDDAGATLGSQQAWNDTNVGVLSYAFWQQRFGGARDVIGKTLKLDDGVFQVIGVMPPEFAFPAKDSQVWSNAKDAEIWVPINSDERWTQFQKVRVADAFGVVGRLKAGITSARAQAEMAVVARRLAQEYPETDAELDIRAVPLPDYVVAPRLRLTLWLFLGAVALVLLIACANVAGLFVSKTFARRKAFAIQLVLGARSRDILRQLFAEAAVLALVAGVAGLALAMLGVKALKLAAPESIPGLENVGLNGTVLAFMFCISLAAAILSSVAPALRISRTDPQEAFRDRAAGSRRGNKLHGLLVFAECALAMVLLTGTGLLVRSVMFLQRVDLGFRADHLISIKIQLHGEKYAADDALRNFVDDAIRRVNAIPGIESAAVGSVFLGRVPNSRLEIEGRLPTQSVVDDEQATWTYVSEDFFRTLGIPLLHGRSFSTADGPSAPPVVIVNQLMARRLWPGDDPIGKRFRYGVPGSVSKEWVTVVGVVGDTVQNGPETSAISVIYYPVRQRVWEVLDLMARTQAAPAGVEKAIASEVKAIDRTIPLGGISTVQQHLWDMEAPRRLQIGLFGLFSFLAMVLAAVGIYGVMAYAVGQRTREIGVRMALGARRRDVLTMILRQRLSPALLGLAAGTGIALGATRALRGLLFGVTPADPATYAVVCAVLLACAAIAAYVPSRRAMRVEPVVALRCE